jgi:hypothetical protein
MKNDCNICDGWGSIVVGIDMWILGEEIVEEDKWQNCPSCNEENYDNSSCDSISKK